MRYFIREGDKCPVCHTTIENMQHDPEPLKTGKCRCSEWYFNAIHHKFIMEDSIESD